MSAALAMAPTPAPHERSSSHSDMPAPQTTSTTTTTSAPLPPPTAPTTNVSPSAQRPAPRKGSSSPYKKSPPSAFLGANAPPKIVVKKEPGSPTMPTSRPRPSRLDLSKNKHASNGNGLNTGRPMTARGDLAIQDIGLHCLSPGFVTDDPHMKDHIQRSMSVREQQRHLIEARLHQQSARGDAPSEKDRESGPDFAAKTPGMSRRNKAPPGLSIVAPSHKQFAHERVIQSAPLGHSFTGRSNPAPMSRHFANQPTSHLPSSSHITHVPANQTNNRLPPISDVFSQGLSSHPEQPQSHFPMGSARHPPASPPRPSHPSGPPSARPREFKSAEEAQQELAGGRPELLPKLVHYGGHQPPTPPSPAPGSRPMMDGSRSASKRRTRTEYEDGASPPLGYGNGPSKRSTGPFGAGRDSPETQRQKKEEFLRLCDRAWDLFHS